MSRTDGRSVSKLVQVESVWPSSPASNVQLERCHPESQEPAAEDGAVQSSKLMQLSKLLLNVVRRYLSDTSLAVFEDRGGLQKGESLRPPNPHPSRCS